MQRVERNIFLTAERRYYVRAVGPDGRRREKTLDPGATKKDARKTRQRLKEGPVVVRNWTLRDCLENYNQHLCNRDGSRIRTDADGAEYHLDLACAQRQLEKHLNLSLPANETTLAMLHNYRQARAKAGRAPATINKEMAMLSSAVDLACGLPESGVIRNAVQKVKPLPAHNVRDRIEPWGVVKRIAGRMPPITKPIIALAYFTGLRISSITSLTWGQYSDPTLHGTVGVPHLVLSVHKTAARTGALKPPLRPEAVTVLRWLWNRRPPRAMAADQLFPFTADRLRRYWSLACEKQGVGDFRLHDLCHCFITLMAAEGQTDIQIMHHSGRNSIGTVLRYFSTQACRLDLNDPENKFQWPL